MIEFYDHAVKAGFRLVEISKAGSNFPPTKGWNRQEEGISVDKALGWIYGSLNVGIGCSDTCIAIDCDTYEAAKLVYSVIGKQTLWTRSPRGYHSLVRVPVGVQLKTREGKCQLGRDIDIRASGGYVVGPGSWRSEESYAKKKTLPDGKAPWAYNVAYVHPVLELSAETAKCLLPPENLGKFNLAVPGSSGGQTGPKEDKFRRQELMKQQRKRSDGHKWTPAGRITVLRRQLETLASLPDACGHWNRSVYDKAFFLGGVFAFAGESEREAGYHLFVEFLGEVDSGPASLENDMETLEHAWDEGLQCPVFPPEPRRTTTPRRGRWPWSRTR